MRWVWTLALAGALLGGSSPAVAAPTACAEQPSVLTCDADVDGIVDLVEEAICGTATCATGREDADANGVPDAEELAESLATGGPRGPVQPSSPSSVIVIAPDGGVAEYSLWPVAGAAGILIGLVGAYIVRRRRSNSLQSRHRIRELQS